MKEETNFISKKLFIDSDFIETSFEGNEVLNHSISPKGVAKVKINLQTGMVSIERCQDDFTGEISLNFETTDGVDNYNHEYKITFKNAGNEILEENDDLIELSEDDELDEIIDDNSEGIEYLSDDEEEAIVGAGTITKRTKTIYVNSGRSSQVIVSSTFAGSHSWTLVSTKGSQFGFGVLSGRKKANISFSRKAKSGDYVLVRCTSKNNGTTYYESWKVIVD